MLLAIVSVQGGAAFAKNLFPALGSAGTAGMRIGLSALLLIAVFRPPLARLTRAQWVAVIPYGVVLGAMNLSFYKALERIPLGLAVTLEFVGPLAVAVFGSRRAADFLWVVLAAVGIALITPWRGGGGALDRTFSILMSLEPAAAAVSGLVFLREQLTVTQWLALVFVSAASAGAALTARRVPPPVEA